MSKKEKAALLMRTFSHVAAAIAIAYNNPKPAASSATANTVMHADHRSHAD